MLKLLYTMGELDFARLSQVYRESIRRAGEANRPDLSEYQQNCYGESVLHEDLMMLFRHGGICAVLTQGKDYVCAMRLESYQDGYLIAGLETDPEYRRRGFAGQLMQLVCLTLAEKGVKTLYSHIKNSNVASIKVHENCGFGTALDHAVFLDGSVDTRSKTYVKRL